MRAVGGASGSGHSTESADRGICIDIPAERSMLRWSDLGSSGAPNVTSVSRNAAAFCRLHRARSELCADRTGPAGGAAVGPKYHKVIYEDQDVRVSGRDAGCEILPRCHHDRIF